MSQIVEDVGVLREELWKIVQEMKIEAFLDCVTSNVPCAEGLLSVTITQRGRLWLKGEDYSRLPPGLRSPLQGLHEGEAQHAAQGVPCPLPGIRA